MPGIWSLPSWQQRFEFNVYVVDYQIILSFIPPEGSSKNDRYYTAKDITDCKGWYKYLRIKILILRKCAELLIWRLFHKQ